MFWICTIKVLLLIKLCKVCGRFLCSPNSQDFLVIRYPQTLGKTSCRWKKIEKRQYFGREVSLILVKRFSTACVVLRAFSEAVLKGTKRQFVLKNKLASEVVCRKFFGIICQGRWLGTIKSWKEEIRLRFQKRDLSILTHTLLERFKITKH